MPVSTVIHIHLFLCFLAKSVFLVAIKIFGNQAVSKHKALQPGFSVRTLMRREHKKEVRAALWPFNNQNQLVGQEKHILGIFSALLFACCCCCSSSTKLLGVSIVYSTWLIGLLTLSCLTQRFLFVLPWRNVCTDKGYRGTWVTLKLC